MNVAGTLLNSALIYAGNNLKLFTDRLHNQHGDVRGKCKQLSPAIR